MTILSFFSSHALNRKRATIMINTKCFIFRFNSCTLLYDTFLNALTCCFNICLFNTNIIFKKYIDKLGINRNGQWPLYSNILLYNIVYNLWLIKLVKQIK